MEDSLAKRFLWNAANAVHEERTAFGDHYISVKPDPGQLSSPGIHDVTVKDNWFYDLVGVCTLGIYSPHDISYHNTKPGVDDGGSFGPATRPGGN